MSTTALWGAMYEGGISSYSDVGAIIIGQYLRNKAPASLEADTDRMCVLLDGEYGNMVPGLLFTGLEGDIVAQDQVWPFMYNVSSILSTWEARTGLNTSLISAWLFRNMNYLTLGNWTNLIDISSAQCPACTDTDSWADLPLWAASVPVC